MAYEANEPPNQRIPPMAKKLQTYDPNDRESPSGRPTIYPWAKWLTEGNIISITRNTDFNCAVSTMIKMAYKQAKALDAEVSIFRDSEDTIVICPKDKLNNGDEDADSTSLEEC